jgi:hypothetical protein
LAVTFSLSAMVVSAQQAAPMMRPVPRTGQVTGATSQPSPTRQGWNLKWRRSPNVVDRSQQIDRSASPSAVMPVSGTMQVASNKPQLRSVSPAAYLTTPQRHESLLDSSGGSSAHASKDYFNDPFGNDGPFDNRDNIPNQLAQRSRAVNSSQNGETFSLPSQERSAAAKQPPAAQASPKPATPALSPDSRPMNDLRDSLNTLDSAADLFDMPEPQSLSESLAPPETKANPSLKKVDNGPSLRDLLKETEPEELPAPNRSNNEGLDDEDFENPFGIDQNLGAENDGGNDLRARDQRDRQRLNSDDFNDYDSRNDGRFDNEDDDLRKTEGLSCNDFRSRIQRQTIDQVSLDISPPYRPDEIDQSRYDKLKSKFDEKQELRQWRNISGVPVANGRLRDLAYEKAVIETEYGSTELIPIDQLSEGDLAYLSQNWGLPQECRLEQVAFVERSWTPMTMTWKASNLCHNPLYFEDVNLERYGHTHGPVLEPLVQTAHFFGNIAVLPYKMGVHGPTECQYALGYYRPGNCAPWIKPPVPLSVRGAYVQAATMTGLFWLIP